MNHLTLHAYEVDGELSVYRCPECGSTGPTASRCGAHEPLFADHGWKGPKRKPVWVPGVGEEPRYTLEEVRAGLLSKEVIGSLTRQIVRESDGEVISLAYDKVRDAVAESLDHFTQQPAGVGVDAGRESDGMPVSADSDGNQQRDMEDFSERHELREKPPIPQGGGEDR